MTFSILSSTFITCLSSCQYWTPDCHPPSLTLCTLTHASGYLHSLSAMPYPRQFSTDSDLVCDFLAFLLQKLHILSSITMCFKFRILIKWPLLNWDIIQKYKIHFTHFTNSWILHNKFLLHKECSYFNREKVLTQIMNH